MLKFKLLTPTAICPLRALPGDAGLDAFSPIDFNILPGKDYLISLEVACEFCKYNVLMVCNKSGISTKRKILVGADTIDSNYRGPIHIHLFNFSNEIQYFKRGDKLAQLLLFCINVDKPVIVEALTDSNRGDNGFGSTGTNINN